MTEKRKEERPAAPNPNVSIEVRKSANGPALPNRKIQNIEKKGGVSIG